MWSAICLATFVFSGGLAYILVFPCQKLAKVLGILDYPAARKIHAWPTPLLGGLAIYGSFLLTIAAALSLLRLNVVPAFVQPHVSGIFRVSGKLSAVASGGLLVVAFGLLDDIIGLKAWQKLCLQILSSLIIFAAGIRISLLMENITWSAVVTVAWLVVMMNSFNLLDNMDGLSSGVALVSGGILLLAALSRGQLFVAAILAVFLGSTAGFFCHNLPPARIFMGESGSSFLGYFLGTASVLLTYYHYDQGQTFLPFFTPLVVFAVPFFDTLSVIWIRWRRRLPIFQADKNHFSHRLVELGLTRKQAVGVIFLLSFCTGLGALLLPYLDLLGGILILIHTASILGIVTILETTGRRNHAQTNRGA
ncbi:MAG: undecaprenyl/decaprenyl-phosphate alpha-N-acetylglucosaminyl 1-phosphate transferase [Candidatus Omnitrophica bacterium]|nr:undecaprenyl/decaprenyl-phosphate alpha-N-acetylglucosaminyl 1-phosphate transferase [Candidatus Omnitrophota bacterium]